ncbi:MAG: hypothetical protein FWE83_00205 [Oscillospiraceae bacterium]|nr:hypothetical protein [Oscillospiraceae bacterium]
MYIENVRANYVTTDYNVYAPQYQPQNNTKEESYGFQDILTETICETAPPYQPYSYTENPIVPAVSENETESTYVGAPAVNAPVDNAPAANAPPVNAPPVNAPPVSAPAVSAPAVQNTYPMNSIPPVIKTQEASETEYISKYYTIPESQVVPKIIEVRQIINSTDMTGKTDAEKYNFIENRFVDAFGKDFMMARNLFLPSSMFYMIGVEFNDTLGRHIENPEQVNRQRLHGDAGSETIQNNIRNNFPADLTNRDLILMVNQMRSEGVLDVNTVRSVGNDGARRIMDTFAVLRNYIRYSTKSNDEGGLGSLSAAERDRRWINMLDRPVNSGQLFNTFNVWKQYGRMDICPNTTNFFVDHMGAKLGPDGYFIVEGPPSSGDTVWWDKFFDMMFGEFAEYDAMIRDRMDMINGEYNSVAGASTAAGEAANAGATADVGETAGVEAGAGVAAGYGVGETAGAETGVGIATGESAGAQESIAAGESAGAEENHTSEESAGAEENTDTAEAGDQQADGSAEGNSQAA